MCTGSRSKTVLHWSVCVGEYESINALLDSVSESQHVRAVDMQGESEQTIYIKLYCSFGQAWVHDGDSHPIAQRLHFGCTSSSLTLNKSSTFNSQTDERQRVCYCMYYQQIQRHVLDTISQLGSSWNPQSVHHLIRMFECLIVLCEPESSQRLCNVHHAHTVQDLEGTIRMNWSLDFEEMFNCLALVLSRYISEKYCSLCLRCSTVNTKLSERPDSNSVSFVLEWHCLHNYVSCLAFSLSL